MAKIEIIVDKAGTIHMESSFDKPLALTEEEQSAINIIYGALAGLNTGLTEIHAERRSVNYLSIAAFSDYDFIRLKVGARAKWFSVFLSPADRSELADDPRFADIAGKGQFHWKVRFSRTEELGAYTDLFQRAFAAARWSYEKTISKM